MPGIIEGYTYDVFISYRQNDNKYDGWVTSFVTNLNKELEATIKDKIAVYFDANPQDGLLETHSVDKSLEDKLKCLIFIPILSRTYCDTASFAWNFEFLPFLKTTRQDRLGLNIRLRFGNVASRVLPVRIHDLNQEDIKLVETHIGVIRSIDFIYKSTGVNRPLRANEDHPQDNLNKTYYRDQINKAANAIDEIICSIKSMQLINQQENSLDKRQESSINIEHNDIQKTLKVKDKQQRRASFKKYIYTLLIIVPLLGIVFSWNVITKILGLDNSKRESAKLHVENAVNLFSNNDYEAAKSELDLALKSDPKYSYAWSTLAAVSVKQSNLNNAIQETIEAIKFDPHNHEAAYNMAYALDDKKDFLQATKWYLKAIEIDSTFIPAYSALGRIYNLQNIPIDAILILDLALKKYPESEYNYLLYKNLGNAYLLQGINDTAIKYLELSKAIKPDEPETNLYLAKAYEAVSETNKSINYWQNYIELEADTVKIREAKVHLKEISIRHLREIIQ
ncbi:MAG: hypothetical protein V1903_02480 [Bacteroidota bacterium]